ncbi:MAG: type III-A CRISPR-associated RAMP protein Csm4 [Anaerolineae bacterium]|nr:type III-A CRISPR-associated RAMP protein Csm4 [Anaerolineae bacterium]
MNTQLFYLETLAAFHLGERGVGLEETNVVAHADTVFSALCLVYREKYGDEALRALLEHFTAQGQQSITLPFVLSSAYPFIRLSNDTRLPLFPRPLSPLPGIDPHDLAVLKQLKHVAFVSWTLFDAWLSGNGQVIADSLPGAGGIETRLQEQTVWVTAKEALAITQDLGTDEKGNVWLWRAGEVPRVSIDRASNASEIYQAGRVRFAPGGGLWVGFQWLADPEAWQAEMLDLLAVLGDAGLGGERSAGHGQFRIAATEAIDLPSAGEYFVTLSPCWPASAEEAAALLDARARYTLLPRRGWMGSPDPQGHSLRRKSVRMLGEGSVLASPGYGLVGGLADVTPDKFKAHRVYRYGIALPVGVTREANR